MLVAKMKSSSFFLKALFLLRLSQVKVTLLFTSYALQRPEVGPMLSWLHTANFQVLFPSTYSYEFLTSQT